MLLRLATAGSVDDGKSTLIGRLLHDTQNLAQDHWHQAQQASLRRGDESIDLALLTDGLRAEREQRITIDVAYRYFATPKRRFILADSPGHSEFTRNMVTGASNAEVLLLLVDARKGMTTQTRRHAFLSSLLGIPHMVVVVNKMDLVDFSEQAFEAVRGQFEEFSRRTQIREITFIPLVAKAGDNLVSNSPRMPWYQGPSLLQHLENVHPGSLLNVVDFRFAVQYVLRPDQHFRGLAGTINSGRIQPGHPVVVLPGGLESRIRRIFRRGQEVPEAMAGQAIVLELEDELEAGRGSLLVPPRNLPHQSRELDAMLCWFAPEPLRPGQRWLLAHTTRQLECEVQEITYGVDIDTLHREQCTHLDFNQVGRVQFHLAETLCFDRYQQNRATGGFVLIDPQNFRTVAAGMVRGRPANALDPKPQRNPQQTLIFRENRGVTRAEKEARQGHQSAICWFTGLPASGKSTLAQALERQLFEQGVRTFFLDGDNLRHGLNQDLGFNAHSRRENIRRASEVAALALEQGNLVLCSFISPFREDRAEARRRAPEGRFFEIFVHCSAAECQRRDPKGLWARAQKGEIQNFTGLTSPYEEPEHPELRLDTEHLTQSECLEHILNLLRAKGILPCN